MTIPLNTTTITIQRVPDDQSGTPDDEPTWGSIATGVRAHFTLRQTGTEYDQSEGRSAANSILMADPCDMQQGDRILDETTGAVWDVMWVIQRPYFGGSFDYMRAEVAKRTAEMGVLF